MGERKGGDGGNVDLLCHIDVQELRFPGVDLECVCPFVLAAILTHDYAAGESSRNHSCRSDVASSQCSCRKTRSIGSRCNEVKNRASCQLHDELDGEGKTCTGYPDTLAI